MLDINAQNSRYQIDDCTNRESSNSSMISHDRVNSKAAKTLLGTLAVFGTFADKKLEMVRENGGWHSVGDFGGKQCLVLVVLAIFAPDLNRKYRCLSNVPQARNPTELWRKQRIPTFPRCRLGFVPLLPESRRGGKGAFFSIRFAPSARSSPLKFLGENVSHTRVGLISYQGLAG